MLAIQELLKQDCSYTIHHTVWCMVYVVCCMAYGVWLAYGVWRMAGVWCMVIQCFQKVHEKQTDSEMLRSETEQSENV